MLIRNSCQPIFPAIYLFIILATISLGSLAQVGDKIIAGDKKSQIQDKYGLDPATSFLSRIKETPVDVMKMFQEAGMSPRQHPLIAVERIQVENAFAALPPLHQIVLKQHLRSISFLDNMPNTALTSVVNSDDTFRLYDITFRAEILRQNVSEWLTEKERLCFAADGSALRVAIEAGTIDAIVYILMHEATHVVDGSLGLLAEQLSPQKAGGQERTFTSGVWSERTVFAPQYRNTLLDSTRYRIGGKAILIDSAISLYRALARTPFASLYSSSSENEDLAEFLSLFHFTQKLKQTLRIIISNQEKKLFVLEPMKSKKVKRRMHYMQVFYRDSLPA